MTGLSCYCDDTDHDQCWDGIITQPNPDCSCCCDTLQSIDEITKA